MAGLDRDAFGKAVALIKEGKVVVIFPEGSRSLDGRLQSAKPGIGMIVAKPDVLWFRPISRARSMCCRREPCGRASAP